MAGARVVHVQILIDQIALVDSTGLQLRIGALFTEPSHIRELERCITTEITYGVLHSGRDDLTKRTWAKLMFLTDSSAVHPGLKRILLKLFVPDEFWKRIDGAPFVASIQEGNTAG